MSANRINTNNLSEEQCQQILAAIELARTLGYRDGQIDGRRLAYENSAREAEHYANTVCGDQEAGQHAKSACFFVASRIRGLKV